MTKLEHIYWIAGYLDGEGYFGFSDCPVIAVNSTDRDLIQKLVIYAKLNITVYEKKPDNPNHSTQWTVHICGSLAIQWMMTIYSLLCKRRQEKIRLVLNKWKSLGLMNKSKLFCPKGHSLSGKNLAIEYTNNGVARRCKICRAFNNRKWRDKGTTNVA